MSELLRRRSRRRLDTFRKCRAEREAFVEWSLREEAPAPREMLGGDARPRWPAEIGGALASPHLRVRDLNGQIQLASLRSSSAATGRHCENSGAKIHLALGFALCQTRTKRWPAKFAKERK